MWLDFVIDECQGRCMFLWSSGDKSNVSNHRGREKRKGKPGRACPERLLQIVPSFFLTSSPQPKLSLSASRISVSEVCLMPWNGSHHVMASGLPVLRARL